MNNKIIKTVFSIENILESSHLLQVYFEFSEYLLI